jgi:hypothetical protein
MVKSAAGRSLAVALLATVGFVSVLSANHSWGGYHWARKSNPFTLKVGDNVSSTWDGYLDEAIADWNPSEVLDLTKVAGSTRPKSCRPTSGRIEVCNASYGNTGWLGIAQIWVTGSVHITQAITKVNDYYFSMPVYDAPAWRRLVMCQEIAHDFGLDHQDEVFDNPNLGSCMDYTSDPDGPPSNEHPNSHDFAQLGIIYAHLDSATTVGSSTLPQAMPPAMGINLDTPSQWGQLVASSAGGRAQVYDLDFGRGNHVITHVFWADPDADAQ